MVDEGHLITVELGMAAQTLLDDALQVFLVDGNFLFHKTLIFVILHRIHMAHDGVLLPTCATDGGQDQHTARVQACDQRDKGPSHVHQT
jgi:hypothetical protein